MVRRGRRQLGVEVKIAPCFGEEEGSMLRRGRQQYGEKRKKEIV